MSSNSSPLPADDRRNLGLRLSRGADRRGVAVCDARRRVLDFQVAQHQKFDEMAENNHRRRLPLPAPRGVLFDRNGKVLVENQNTFNIALDREQSGNIDETLRILAAATGADEAQMQRNGQSPPARTELSADRADRERDLGAGDCAAGPAARAARHHQAGSAGAAVSAERARRASLWLRRRGERSDLSRPEYAGAESGSMVGKAGVENVVQQAADGQGRRQLVVVNSRGREMGEARARTAVEGRRVQLTIDADVQRAAEEGFRHFGYNGAAVDARPALGRSPGVHQPAGVQPESVRRRHRPRDWNSLMTDELQAAAESRAPGHAIRRARRSRSRSPSAALEEGIVTPDFRVFCPGGATFYGRYFQCHSRAATARSTCGTRSRSPATSTSTRSATCSASIASTSGRRSSASASQRASICRARSRAWCRRPSGRRRRASRSGTRARRFRVDRPGPGRRDADFAGGDDDDDRQRRHALHAARRQGGRRGQGLGAGAGAATAVDGRR